LEGLTTAVERHGDSAWVEPILRHNLQTTGRLNGVLLARLSPRQFQGFAVHVLGHSTLKLVVCSDLILAGQPQMDLPTAALWLETVARLAVAGGRSEWSILQQLPARCAMALPPGVRDQIESLWGVSTEPWNHFHGGVEKLLKVLELRQQIQKEFTV
jgi:hypothetical protein